MKIGKANLSKAVSWIFNPFVLLVPLQVVLFHEFGRGFSDWRLYVVLVSQVLAVFGFVVIAKWFGAISDLEITNRVERERFVFLVFSLFAASALFVLSDWELARATLSITLASFFVAVITDFFDWKISGHLTYDTVILLSLTFVEPWFGLALLSLPLVFWSRLIQKKHTWLQLFAGFLLGTFSTLIFFTNFLE